MKYLIPLALLICSCSNKMMNEVAYSDVMIGMDEKELVNCYGKPYAVCTKKDGSLEYEYIEHFNGYNRKVMQVNYYITIKNGLVTHKNSKKSYPPGYMYDSLDYQSKRD